jgi:hypothetical protein
MQQRVMAARSFFWVVLALNTVAVLLAIPSPNDAKTSKAIQEIRAFGAGFDPKQKKQALIQEADQKANPTLAEIAEQTLGPGVDKLIAPDTRIQLATVVDFNLASLYAVRMLSKPNTRIQFEGPTAKEIAESLRWRLARMGSSRGYRLASLKWSRGGASKADFELERRIEVSRLAALKARRAYLRAVNTRDAREKILKSRLKHRASNKRIRQARREYVESKAEVFERRALLDETRTLYQELAERAGAFAPNPSETSKSTNAGFAVVTASIENLRRGKTSELNFPVSIRISKVPVTPLSVAPFSATKAAGLWPATKFVSFKKAIQIGEANYSWHNQGFEMSSTRLGGPTLLYILPLILAVSLFIFALRCRHPRAGYNPFMPEKSDLPKVGLGISTVDFTVVVVLPLVASLLCGWSLAGIDGNLVISVIVGTIAVGIAAWCYKELATLNNLNEDIRRTSIRPPARR